jgi:fructose-1,6-bisphosphatase-3
LERKTVRQTDVGKKLTQQVTDLQQLLRAYKSGEIVEDLLSDK